MICKICSEAMSVVDRYRKYRGDDVHDDCLLDLLLSGEEPIVEYKFLHGGLNNLEKDVNEAAKQGWVIGGVNHMDGTTFLIIAER